MPWKTLCGFPPNGETITLRIPNGLWRPDTVITDYEGTEMFVLLDQVQSMRSYEAIFGDLDGRRLVCIKRHLITAFWRDGYYFCTYKPNYKNQRPLLERDVDNKKVYPFSYLQVSPMKGRFYYRMFDNQEGLSAPKMRSENPWLGFMVVCCTPIVRTGKWTASFRRKNQTMPTIHLDQWRNCVDIGPGNDVLAALCMAYVFDRYQCQPLVTVVGGEKEQYLLQPDDQSIESDNEDNNNMDGNTNDIEGQNGQMYFDNAPNGNNRQRDYDDDNDPNHHQQRRDHNNHDDDDDNNNVQQQYDETNDGRYDNFNIDDEVEDEFVNSNNNHYDRSHPQPDKLLDNDDNDNDDEYGTDNNQARRNSHRVV